MQQLKRNRILATILALFIIQFAIGQNLENPGEYMTAITNAQADMNKKYMAYVSAAAHGKRLKKVEKLRQQAVESITESRYKVTDLPFYKGDKSLRQSAIDYIQFCYKIFNEDYAHIVNMEEIAEQSFDEMQAYLLLQEKTSEKLKEANEKVDKAYTDFGAKYNVKISNEKSELGEKMETAGKLNHYHNQVYLVFFKCNWEDEQLTKAMNKKKVNDIEQCRNALIKYATEGLLALDSLKSFQGDPSLAATCRQALQFYKKTAETEVPKLTDFFLKEENFEKMKKAFDAKSESDRKKADVDAFNKGVKEINDAVNTYNNVNNNINNGRNQLIQNWNNTEKAFFDTHMPYYK